MSAGKEKLSCYNTTLFLPSISIHLSYIDEMYDDSILRKYNNQDETNYTTSVRNYTLGFRKMYLNIKGRHFKPIGNTVAYQRLKQLVSKKGVHSISLQNTSFCNQSKVLILTVLNRIQVAIFILVTKEINASQQYNSRVYQTVI